MVKTMERLDVGDRPLVGQQQEPQIRNPNFRRPQFPQIIQREQRNPVDQQVIPPFQENIVAEDTKETEDHIHCLDKNDPNLYLTKEEHHKSY
jgi:hypothetical protein